MTSGNLPPIFSELLHNSIYWQARHTCDGILHFKFLRRYSPNIKNKFCLVAFSYLFHTDTIINSKFPFQDDSWIAENENIAFMYCVMWFLPCSIAIKFWRLSSGRSRRHVASHKPEYTCCFCEISNFQRFVYLTTLLVGVHVTMPYFTMPLNIPCSYNGVQYGQHLTTDHIVWSSS